MGLMGGMGWEEVCKWMVRFHGFATKGVMSTSHRMSIDSHNCGVSIFRSRRIEIKRKVHGHAVQALD